MDLKIKEQWQPNRYGTITYPHKSEIVLLRGRGCFHSACKFCDYHLDKSNDKEENFMLNKGVLDQVKGIYNELEVICSGSVQELDDNTMSYIKDVCEKNEIALLSMECHYVYKNSLSKIKEFFYPIEVKFRIGVESFDINWRENLMNKKMGNVTVEEIAKYFDYCNLLVGIKSQTKEQILEDIKLAEKHFERVCVGVYEANATSIKRDEELALWFENEVSVKLRSNDKFQILINVEDFPLGDGCMSEVIDNE